MNSPLNVLGVQNCLEIVSPDRSGVSLNDQCFKQSYGNEGCSSNLNIIAGSSSSSPHVESLDSEFQNVKDEQYVYTESSENQTRVDDIYMCQTLNDKFVTDTDILGLLDVSNDQIFNDFSHYVNTKCNFNWYLGVAAPDDYIYPDFTNNYMFDSSQSLATDCNDILLHDEIFFKSGRPNYAFCRRPVESSLNISVWRKYIADYHDPKVVEFLEFGWPLNYTRNVYLTRQCDVSKYQEDIDNYISKELTNGGIVGPFHDNPFRIKPSVAPIFTVPKKEGGRRVIVDCSFGGEASVNAGIKIDSFLGVESCLHYPRHEQFIDLLVKCGRKCKIWKADLSPAFRQFAVDPHDYVLQCFKWRDDIYVDKRLIFGMRSSPQACQRITNFVNYILSKENIISINYIDDFGGVSTASEASSCYSRTLNIFKELGLKVSPDKCCPPSCIMTFLGKEYNTETMTVRIPEEKMTDIIECVTSFKHKKKCTKRQLQQLIGKLAFAAECVRSGRLFISRMLSVLRKYKYNHYRVSLNNEFRKDVMWWIEFFKTFNGLSYIPEVVWTPPDIIFSTDALYKD